MENKESGLTYVACCLSVLAILSVVFLISYGGMQKSTDQNRFVSITASGTASGYPDQGTLYLFVNGTGNTSSEALQQMGALSAKINSSAISYINGNASNIKTESYNIYKVYNSTQWQASETISITVPSVSNINPLIGIVGGISGVGIQSVQAQLSASKYQSLLMTALKNAEQNATSQAQGVVGNRTTLQIQNITIEGYPIYYPLGIVSGAAVSASGGVSPSFFTGTTSVTRNVYVTFKIVG